MELLCAGLKIEIQTEEQSVVQLIERLFAPHLEAHQNDNAINAGKLLIGKHAQPDHWYIDSNGNRAAENLVFNQLASKLSALAANLIVQTYGEGPVLHAGALQKENLAVVIPGKSGSGKTLLSAWLCTKDYQFITDELLMFDDETSFQPFYRPLKVKKSDIGAFQALNLNTDQIGVSDEAGTQFHSPAATQFELRENQASVLLFPVLRAGEDISIQMLSTGECILELTKTLLNSENLPNSGFPLLSSLARKLPALKVTYGGLDQLEPLLETLLELTATKKVDAHFLKALCQATRETEQPKTESSVSEIKEPETTEADTKPLLATPISDGHRNKLLTITMATYDDYDGVYFTLQSLRLHHAEILDKVEILIIDNNPRGKCGEPLRRLAAKGSNIRYIPEEQRRGTAVRDLGFTEANSDFVLCLDCHVLIDPGAVKKLIEYYENNPDTKDLIHGPMLDDFLTGGVLTHFDPVWRTGMYGVWGVDERGKDPSNPAFEIPMQGLGLFSCRKSAWPGFNPRFRGFGGEEGYIHEKFRQAGGRVLCLPFLRWLHRFERPLGVPYELNWHDRIVNYLLGFRELNLDEEEVKAHFSDFLNESAVERALVTLNDEI